MPIVLSSPQWIETWRSAGENSVFEGPAAGWTAGQRRLVSITREYASFFSTLSLRGHEPPKQEILENYPEFRKWWDEYLKDPEIGDNQYSKYSHGFSAKR